MPAPATPFRSNPMKLVSKLSLAVAGGLLVVAAAGGVGLAMMQSAVDAYSGPVQAMNDRAREIAQVRSHFQTQVQEWKNVLLRGADDKQRERYWTGFEKSERAVAEGVQALVAALAPGESRALVERFAAAHARMGQGYRSGFESFKAASFDHAAGDRAVQGMDREPNQTLAQAIEAIAAEAAAGAAAAEVAARRAWWISVLAVLLAGAATLALSAWFVRASLRRLEGTAAVAERVAQGDLTSPIAPSGSDEITQLESALARMQRSLGGIVATVRGNADSVATASAQIAQGNLDLSQRTEEQASALQQTAASMEQLGATVRHNADNARQADQMAQGAHALAARGGEVVTQAVQTMRGINERAQKMADIIGVIDGIAFQTNILALNAAVEAARAGEQGRGFAVVAGEVRSLAQRSAQAAKEIKVLIGDSVEHVEQGTTLVDRAGATMQEMLASIRRVSDLVGEISAASTEQSSGVAQVGQAVTQMDQATQQNAALVEESAAAADALRQQARQLVDAVAVFRLAQDTGPATAAGQPAAAALPAKVQAAAALAAAARGPATRSRPAAATRPAAPAQVGQAAKAANAAQADRKPAPATATAGDDDWTSF